MLNNEKRRFYEIARGPVVEMDIQSEIAINLGYYKKGEVAELEQGPGIIFQNAKQDDSKFEGKWKSVNLWE